MRYVHIQFSHLARSMLGAIDLVYYGVAFVSKIKLICLAKLIGKNARVS